MLIRLSRADACALDGLAGIWSIWIALFGGRYRQTPNWMTLGPGMSQQLSK
jgi:hypothetical protein